MAWTSGFFNSDNGDRLYTADQMSAIFNGLITDGVYESVTNKLAVEPNNGMTVQINTGRGWFGGKWVDNDSPYLITLEDSDVTLNRYAAICVRADVNYNARTAEPYVKYSALATYPVKPTMERSETVKEYCLAYVYIKAGTSSITASNIEDTRANSNLCGWVTGLIKQVDTKTLWAQWEALFGDFMDAKESEFTEWYNSLVDYIDDNTETKLVADVIELQNRVVKSSGTISSSGWTIQEDGTYNQTVTVEGVTATNDVAVNPSVVYMDRYIKMGCEPISQGVNTITFKCTNPDDTDMIIDVIIYNFA